MLPKIFEIFKAVVKMNALFLQQIWDFTLCMIHCMWGTLLYTWSVQMFGSEQSASLWRYLKLPMQSPFIPHALKIVIFLPCISYWDWLSRSIIAKKTNKKKNKPVWKVVMTQSKEVDHFGLVTKNRDNFQFLANYPHEKSINLCT